MWLRPVMLTIQVVIWVLLTHQTFAQSWDPPRLQILFQSGSQGYEQMRIPALIKTTDGSLLAFAEARKEAGDAGDIDLVCRRSSDQGKTWSEVFIIWDDEENTCGNPCPVVDQETGTIFLLMTHNWGQDREREIINGSAQSTRTVWICQSNDQGISWSRPREITAQTKNPDWGWYATGPGIGIQLQNGPRAGRLIIPCDHSFSRKDNRGGFEYGSHVIYSDDHGQTWQLGGVIRPKVNECQVVELNDGNGSLLMNMRSYFGNNLRTQSKSYDGGISWTVPQDVPDLVEPVCQASLIRFSPLNQPRSLLVFANPASSMNRHNLSVRGSHDEGKSWPLIRTIYPGPSAYSSLTKLSDQQVGLLFEGGKENPYQFIYFTTVAISDWIPEVD